MIITQSTKYKPEQKEKARLMFENYTLKIILSILFIY